MSISANTPVVFVTSTLDRWHRLDEQIASVGLERTLMKCTEGRDAWIVATFARLRARGLPVTLSAHFVPGALCIAHRDDIASAEHLWRSFAISVRADRERSFVADLEIVQSPAGLDAPEAFYIPHWSQPGLIPRDERRGNTLRRLGFFGPEKNLAAEFRTPAFKQELARLGMELVIRTEPHQWVNYSDIDAVLAVRDGQPYFLAGKPSAKLFNAWRAGCPAFVGSEPAFHHHGTPGRDFVYVTNAAELLRELQKIAADPAIYRDLRAQAMAKGRVFTAAYVEDAWIQFFENEALPRYHRWRSQRPFLRQCRSIAAHGYGLFRQRLRGNLYTRGYDIHGNPIVSRRTVRRRIALLIDSVLSEWDQRQRSGTS